MGKEGEGKERMTVNRSGGGKEIKKEGTSRIEEY